MEITGTIKQIIDKQIISERFCKQDFVLTTDENSPYPQHISLQAENDKCDQLNKFNEGDQVKVQINIKGREWNGPQGVKYFNTISIWKIEKI